MHDPASHGVECMDGGKVTMRRADRLRDQLEQEIVTGVLAPGARLDEQALADRFKVSRTPIREALMQLASAGLVTTQAHRGAFVTALGLRDIVERRGASPRASVAACSRRTRPAGAKPASAPPTPIITATRSSTTLSTRPHTTAF